MIKNTIWKISNFLLLFLNFFVAFQQYQQFSYLSGSNAKYGVEMFHFKEKGVYDPENSLGKLYGFSSFLTRNETELVICFGRDDHGTTDRIWKYSIQKKQWMFYSGRVFDSYLTRYIPKYNISNINQYSKENYIGGRTLSKGWKISENGEDIITFFGGKADILNTYSKESFSIVNEMWRYNVAKNQYMLIHYNTMSIPKEGFGSQFESIGEYNCTNIPGSRYNHEMVELNDGEVLLLAGTGYSYDSGALYTLSDWWIYSTVLNQWKCMGGDFPNPDSSDYIFGKEYKPENNIGQRKDLSAVKISSEEIFIFGGSIISEEELFVSVYQKYNISSNQFKFLGGKYDEEGIMSAYAEDRGYNENNQIGARKAHFMFLLNEEEIGVFGGFGISLENTYFADGDFLCDFWQFNLTSEHWKFEGKENSRYPNRLANIPTDQGEYSDETMIGGIKNFAGGYISSSKDLLICAGEVFRYSYEDEPTSDDCWKMYFGNVCFSKEDRDESVCSSHGICADHDTCICNEGYYGTNCELTKCFDHFSNDTEACNKKGLCIEANCLCYESSSYNNPDCSIDEELKQLEENLWIYVLVPALIVVFIVVIIIVVIFSIFLCFKLSKTLKKFDGIEDVDLILKEAKIEQNSTNPKIKIDKSLFEIEYKDINLISIIGEGGSATVVYLAKWKGNFCAYKGFKILTLGSDEFQFEEFEKEVKIYSSINHPSILQFYGACVNPPNVGIILEYCKSGDLSNFLNKYVLTYQRHYEINEKIRILKQIASGMDYIHSINILHRDLKPENVLIDDKENAKIMDFGLSKLSRNEEKTLTKRIGTSYYMAPEVFSGEDNYTNSCDVYSFAILAFVVITENFFPYGIGLNQSRIIQKVSKNPNFRPKIEENKFEECKFLIEIMNKNWNHDPKQRSSFKEIVKVLEIEEKELEKKNILKEDDKIDEKGLKIKIQELTKRLNEKDEKIGEMENQMEKKDLLINDLRKRVKGFH